MSSSMLTDDLDDLGLNDQLENPTQILYDGFSACTFSKCSIRSLFTSKFPDQVTNESLSFLRGFNDY